MFSDIPVLIKSFIEVEMKWNYFFSGLGCDQLTGVVQVDRLECKTNSYLTNKLWCALALVQHYARTVLAVHFLSTYQVCTHAL